MSQVVSRGFIPKVVVDEIIAIKPYSNKEKTSFNVTINTRNVMMTPDEEMGFKETVESLNIRINCDNMEELKQLSEYLLKCRSTKTPFFVETTMPDRDVDIVAIKDRQPFLKRGEDYNCVSIYSAKEIYNQDVKIAVELNKAQTPKS
ncbi:MAG: hypothetical protein V2A75_00915 [Pseudomonadota bacterium]